MWEKNIPGREQSYYDRVCLSLSRKSRQTNGGGGGGGGGFRSCKTLWAIISTWALNYSE